MDILRKYTFLCSLVLVCLKCASAQDTTSALFSSWAKQHGYQFSGSEYGDRLATFASNLRLIENHALSGAPYSLGLTSFAHLTFDEFRSMYLSQDVSKSCASSTNPAAQLMVYPQTTDLPSSVDWRTQEKTFTPVKNKPSNCTSSSWFVEFSRRQPHLSLSSVASIQSIIPIEYRIENGFKKNKQRAS